MQRRKEESPLCVFAQFASLRETDLSSPSACGCCSSARRSRTRRRSRCAARRIRETGRPTGRVIILLDSQTILDVCHARHRFGDVFNSSFITTTFEASI
jgi:hypothetical protein